MRVKRFVAPTMQDAMIKVKLEMGKDAVIIHTRKFKEGGFLGFFGRQMVEVTAAVEDKVKLTTPQPIAEQQVAAAAQTPPPQAVPVTQSTAQNQSVWPAGQVEAGADEEEEEEQAGVQRELAEMRSLMEKVAEQMDMGKGVEGFPPVLQKFYQNLITNDVEDQLAKRLLKNLKKNMTSEEIGEEDQVSSRLRESLERILKKAKPITFAKNGAKRQTIALVGPTGVGKTTTTAKLAATFSIVDKRKVALITADTYRIAAVEQLKTFGEIIGVPVDVVYTPQEIKEALQRHADKDLVLIDTAGRSHKNVMQMSELKGILEAAEPTGIFLVLSSTTKSRDMLDIVDSYSDIPVSRLIFTKLDETSSCGAILNVVSKTKKSLAYVTVGQSVPDDIEVANGTKLANMMMRER
ncbi:MAG TPA: flagellar biosynthesis protein FlhF [Bacillota bacterium]|nr:flagellar biosynthesis protein FlhF [Bacillota bacterium]